VRQSTLAPSLSLSVSLSHTHTHTHTCMPPPKVPIIVLYDDDAVDPNAKSVHDARRIGWDKVQTALNALVDDNKQTAIVEVGVWSSLLCVGRL
jgi:hypothetical protein